MNAKRGWMLLALVAVLLTSGCFQVQQELWHNPDGSGKVALDVAVSENFLQVVGQGQALPHLFESWRGLADGESSNYANLAIDERIDADVHHYTADMDLKDFSRLGELQRESLDFQVETQDDGSLRFSQRLDFRLDTSDPAQAEMAALMNEGLAGQNYTVRLHVPHPLEADALAGLDAKGGVVEWNIPMLDLIGAAEPVEIWAVYRLSRGPAAWVWVLLGALALGLIALVAWFLSWPRTMPAPKLPPRQQRSREEEATDELP